MSDYYTVKTRIPILAVGQGNCPHSNEFRVSISLFGKGTHYFCSRCWNALDDWNKLTKDKFYERYPELKPLPDYTTMKVTLDEADKIKKI